MLNQTQGTMNKRLPIKSAVMVEMGADGSATRTTLYEQRRKRRGSKRMRPFEKALRRMAEAQSTAANSYLDRHERSNRKKKNGWVKDLSKNISKSSRKGLKKLKMRWI